MYSPQEVQKKLNIPPSTLRKYAALYRDHLSADAHRLQRKYTDGDIAVLKQVQDLREAGVPLRDVSSRLSVVSDTTPADMTAMIPAISERFQTLYDQIAKMALMAADQQREISDLRDKLNELENRSFLERLFPRRRK